MACTRDVDHASPQQGVPAQLIVGASSDNLPVIRSLVENVLLTADLPMSDVSDVTLGVDEISTQIILRSRATDPVGCSLQVGPDVVVVEVYGVLRSGSTLSTDGFGWHVVRTVSDSVTIDLSDGAPDCEVRVTLIKARSIAEADPVAGHEV
ncbi:anti-sigma factor [Williamsia sp. M5A3_1d]